MKAFELSTVATLRTIAHRHRPNTQPRAASPPVHHAAPEDPSPVGSAPVLTRPVQRSGSWKCCHDLRLRDHVEHERVAMRSAWTWPPLRASGCLWAPKKNPP